MNNLLVITNAPFDQGCRLKLTENTILAQMTVSLWDMRI